MGTLKVNGAISATGTISASSFLGNASSATYTCQWASTETNPSTSSTDSNTTTFNKSNSRIYWVESSGVVLNQPSTWGYILDIGNNAERHQIWMTQNIGSLYHRGGNAQGWGCVWTEILDASNYTSYTVTKTGGGASGTWNISITGNAETLNGYNHTQFLKVYDWWNYEDTSKHVNNLVNGSTFAYINSHGSPTTGSILSFSSKTGTYATQIQGEYVSGTDFYFRTQNGDTGSWNPWRKMIHDGNISSQSVNYASGSDYTYGLTGRGITDNITTVPPTGRLVYDYNVLAGTSGLFPHYSNANSIITLNKHAGNYDSQLGFSSNGRIYYRSYNGSALDISSGWNTIAFTSDTVANADTVDGYHASSFLKKLGWWNSSDSHSADNVGDGIAFAYTSHGVPNHWGTLVTFGYGGGTDYNLQLHGAGNNELYFRNRSSDYGQLSWQTIIHSGNYTSYALPKSGGTITATSGDTPLSIKSRSENSYIRFEDQNGTILGYYGVNANKQPVFYYGEDKIILHSGNYTSYCAPASHSHSYASLASPNNMIHSSNEYTFVPEGYSGTVWLNYRAGWSTNGNIGLYIFGNGKGGNAPIEHLFDITHNYGSSAPSSSTPGYGTAGAIYY